MIECSEKLILTGNEIEIKNKEYCIIRRCSKYGNSIDYKGSLIDCALRCETLNKESVYFFYELMNIKTGTIIRV